MDMRFRLFLQEHADGSVTARSLLLPTIAAYASTRAEAIAAVKAALTDHVRTINRRYWDQLIFPEHQELKTVDLAPTPKGKLAEDPIPIRVSILITVEQAPTGHRSVVTAPRIEDFHFVARDPSDVKREAVVALMHYMRKWKSQAIVDADQSGPEGLEVVTISLPEPEPEQPQAPPQRGGPKNTHDEQNVLGLCGVSLTEQSKAGRLGRADRREALVEQMLTTLASSRNSSIMLVGQPGVGKTALVHEVVERIRAGKAPEVLKSRELWFITANNLIAGMKYTGEWQGRTQQLLAQVRKGRQILAMGDPNEIVDAGRWSESDNNMGRFLRPYIESGEITVICEASPEGFKAGLKIEPSFMHAFCRIDVDETDEADTLGIAHAAARRLEAQRNLSFELPSIGAAVELTRRFMPYRAFPGKVVRFLEDIARDVLPGQERSPSTRPIRRADAIASFTRATGLPELILSDEQPMRVPEVRAYFEERLLGQPDAVDAMVDLITVIKAGLNDPQKPLGSFFFVGPTGVGKTEMAKVLAEYLFGSRERMLRFDMSEYAAADALPRLIGTAWRPDSEGELTRRVREQPFCVVLLDEIEKAHREVFDALLGVLGEGRLSDTSGHTADFRNAIIIMTSNLGASRREMHAIGFGAGGAPDDGDDARLRAHFVKEAEQFFRPEFFNRIDRIVTFRPLTLEAMRLITRRELGKLLMREGIVRRNLLVELDDPVIERLLSQGFHPLYGARPLQREIERAVILPLARLLVNRGAEPDPASSPLLRFSVRDGQVDLSFVPLESIEEPLDQQPAPAEQRPPDRRMETDLAALLRAIHALREQAAAEEATSSVQGLRREVSALLARTREPTFWDEQSAARAILSRVYHLERVLKRLDTVSERADYLEEKGRQIRHHRDRRGVPQLAREVETLEAELAYVQMELAGASTGEGHDQALVRVTPLDRETELWAAQLIAMYVAWAARKGYEYTLLAAPPGPDSPPERRPSQLVPTSALLYVRGSNVYEFLRGEAGLHKLHSGTAEERQRNLARVTIIQVPEQLHGDSPEQQRASLVRLGTSAAEAGDGQEDGVARIYHQGKHRYVRDPRTGARVTDVTSVLETGEIDAFLLARLRQTVQVPSS